MELINNRRIFLVNSNNFENQDIESNSQNLQINYRSPREKLPSLKIPTFSGSFDPWIGLYDALNSMIHNDQDIPIIKKFLYLKGCAQRDAANNIASLETTTDNYNVAWEPLKGRYPFAVYSCNNFFISQSLCPKVYLPKKDMRR